MARSKSTSGGKSNRASKDPTGVNNPASIPGVNAAATEPVSSDIKPENRVTPEPRKFEVRKTEPRKNVVPINIEDEIRRRAYELYQQRGPGTGSEAEDWLTAEREVMQRYHQRSAAS
ncbi:MAG: DUF2934 domain-containing protein [Candidatus Sulfotelmatobacter sp.]